MVAQICVVADKVNVLTGDCSDRLWIEEINAEVDLCTSAVTEYLRFRDDTESFEGFAASWVQKYASDPE